MKAAEIKYIFAARSHDMLREDSKGLRGDESRAERLHAKDLLCVSNSLLRAMISSDCLVFTCVAATKSRDRSRVFRLASKRVLVVDSSIARTSSMFGCRTPGAAADKLKCCGNLNILTSMVENKSSFEKKNEAQI